jgi:N-acetyl-1-D-myo-inositol-2-amino-2-deoxy-alpha-D-glucopyranoside deacetylase
MKGSYQGYRALLVHAHPDDETINNGATMAMYAALGAEITLVTCTRGEEGEVLVKEVYEGEWVNNLKHGIGK